MVRFEDETMSMLRQIMSDAFSKHYGSVIEKRADLKEAIFAAFCSVFEARGFNNLEACGKKNKL